jgi:hypothetical protein
MGGQSVVYGTFYDLFLFWMWRGGGGGKKCGGGGVGEGGCTLISLQAFGWGVLMGQRALESSQRTHSLPTFFIVCKF